MNKANLATALILDSLYRVSVRFKHSDGNLSTKTYSYLSTFAVSAGDEVIVDSPYGGMKVVVVTGCDEMLVDLEVECEYKFIVQKVDSTKHDALKANLKAVREELADRERRAQLKAIKKQLGLKPGDKLSNLVSKIRNTL